MKKNLHATPMVFKMAILITSFMLAMIYNQSKAAQLPKSPISFPTIVIKF